MKVAVVGSRAYPDLERVRKYVRQLQPGTVLVSGGAGGVDSVAEATARGRGLEVQIFRPDYQRHGKGAPLVRNRQIMEAAQHVVVFWDGRSSGTANAVTWAIAMGRTTHVILPDSAGLGGQQGP